MSMVPINPANLETASSSGGSRRFGDLRGVQWRIDLGILPSRPSASIDDLRRVTADSRRRYAALRRQLLVDPHVLKDGSRSPDLVMDNPLSQSPDSMWGRFFRNAELERIVDQDLTRLYPERGGYFQTSRCQCMLRRILLLWCLRHPEYGYGQGMHELLAPILYILHVDVERLSEVRKIHDDQFADKFDGFSFHVDDLSYTFDFMKLSESIEDSKEFQNSPPKASSLAELDPEIQTIVLLSDAYGAEGELGIVLSEKFMEHDAYSMFESLMSGGALAMSDFFFSPSPFGNSHSGYPPVIEASTALYHLLAIVDSSLHTHLVDLGVEPQYFALRWLRVLFGREFSLEDLLVVWDEIFACGNTSSSKPVDCDDGSGFGILESPRGAFICAFAVSMILNLRSSLLATQNATSCLQRLLNFPDDVKIANLLAKAKSMHALALEANNSVLVPIRSGPYEERKSTVTRAHSLSLDLTSPQKPLNVVSDSYWEEKWRVLHEDRKGEEKHNLSGNVQNRKKGWSERVKLRLSRTESDPTPSKKKSDRNTIPRPSVRRSLLEDLVRQLGSGENKEIIGCDRDNIDHLESTEVNERDDIPDKNYENASGEESSSNSSDPMGPVNENSDNENECERSSVASNSLIDDNDNGPCGTSQECSPLPLSGLHGDGLSFECTQNDDSLGKMAAGVKERKLLSGKFQWLWKFGRTASEGTLGRESASEDGKACNGISDQDNVAVASRDDGCASSYATSKEETVDQNLMVSLKNLGQSMLENIQVIESEFQQEHQGQTGSLDNFSKNGLIGKGQVTAMAALKELRKISNFLSEM
ncbi:hypothetical protein OROHE_006383 [Orobanche hederae]